MNIVIIVVRAAAVLLLGSTLICGLYLGAEKKKGTDISESIKFHKKIAVVSVVVSVLAVVI
jgi:hypothetical protein